MEILTRALQIKARQLSPGLASEAQAAVFKNWKCASVGFVGWSCTYAAFVLLISPLPTHPNPTDPLSSHSRHDAVVDAVRAVHPGRPRGPQVRGAAGAGGHHGRHRQARDLQGAYRFVPKNPSPTSRAGLELHLIIRLPSHTHTTQAIKTAASDKAPEVRREAATALMAVLRPERAEDDFRAVSLDAYLTLGLKVRPW